MGLRGRTGRTGVKRVKLCPPFDRGEPRCRGDTDSGAFAIRGTCSLLLLLMLRDHLLLLLVGSAAALPSCGLSSLPLGLSCLPSPLPPSSYTPILADFWIFSDQAQLLDPERAASKEPEGAQIRSCCAN